MSGLIDNLNLKKGKSKIAVVVMVCVLLVVSWVGVLDDSSKHYVDETIIQAGVAFAVARSLNAAISALQSTTIEGGVVAASASISVGEVLDPVNDLVEQYSSLMKLSLGSLIIQKILIEIVSENFFKILLTLSGVALIGSLFVFNAAYSGLAFKTFVFLAFIRFAVVMAVLANGVVDQAFIQEKTREDMDSLQVFSSEVEKAGDQSGLGEEERLGIERRKGELESRLSDLDDEIAKMDARIEDQASSVSQASDELAAIEEGKSLLQKYNILSRDAAHKEALEALTEQQAMLEELNKEREALARQSDDISEEITALENTLAGRANSFLESIGKSVSGLADKASSLSGNAIAVLKERLEDMTLSVINLMTVFVLKTLILPLLFLWVLVKLMKIVWGVDLEPWLRKQAAVKPKNKEDVVPATAPSSSGA